MLKKIGISTLVLLALTGCATHQQANTAVGAGTGAIIGNAIGGKGGAAFGAIMGAAVGSNQPTQPNVVIQRQEIIRPDPRGYNHTQILPDYSMCNQWNHLEREACYRGADARAARLRAMQDQQNQRLRDAYRSGIEGR